MGYRILEIIEIATGRVIREWGPVSQKAANMKERAANLKLDHKLYRTRQKPASWDPEDGKAASPRTSHFHRCGKCRRRWEHTDIPNTLCTDPAGPTEQLDCNSCGISIAIGLDPIKGGPIEP